MGKYLEKLKSGDWSYSQLLEYALNDIDERLAVLEAKTEVRFLEIHYPGDDIRNPRIIPNPKYKPVPEASDLYVVEFTQVSDSETDAEYFPATPAQVRAEAVRLGMLDDKPVISATPEWLSEMEKQYKRAKVAEAFLHAALLSEDDVILDGYDDVIEWLNDMADKGTTGCDKKILRRMAAVLEQAAKDGVE